MSKVYYKSLISNLGLSFYSKGLGFFCFFVYLVSCKQVPLEPLHFKSIGSNVTINNPKKIIVISQKDTVLKYKLYYSDALSLNKIEESYWVKNKNKYETNTCEFSYSDEIIKSIKWSGKVDMGIYGKDLLKSSLYSFKYDSLNILNEVVNSTTDIVTNTNTIKTLPFNNVHIHLYLANYNMGNQIDTLKEIEDTATQYVYKKTNNFCDFKYQKSKTNIILLNAIGEETATIKLSSLQNNLPKYLWPIVQQFIEFEGVIPAETHYSMLNPGPFFYFNSYVKATYSVLPYSYNTSFFTYVFDYSNKLESISVDKGGVLNQIKFYY